MVKERKVRKRSGCLFNDDKTGLGKIQEVFQSQGKASIESPELKMRGHFLRKIEKLIVFKE